MAECEVLLTAAADEFHRARSPGIVVAGVTGALIAYVALTAIAMSRNGWNFEYPLDDVYIHLAMAEQIAGGGYGVNPGESASAASSPLYPLLLTPFAGSDMQRWLPLFWNVLALVASAALFANALAQSGFKRAGVYLAAIAPLALPTYVTAFTGMENMAHVAASLAIVLWLWKFVESDRIEWPLFAAVFLASSLRLEGLAMGLAAGGVPLLFGRMRPGILLIVAAVTPIALFSGFLLALGLDPLPNSIIAKLGDTGGTDPFGKFALNVGTYGGRYLLALSVGLLILGAASLARHRRRAYFGLALAATGIAHLTFGSVGWMDRYETYATVACVAAISLMLRDATSAARTFVVGLALAGGALTYAPYALSVYAWNPAAIAQQQGQMARLAKDFVRAPVAVNDLGYVAWRNPNYVLDLWGLASPDALRARREGTVDGWAGPLAQAHDVQLAMVYDEWVGNAVPANWIPLGTLRLDVPTAFLGGRDVAIYATNQNSVEQLKDQLSIWRNELPPRASFLQPEEQQ